MANDYSGKYLDGNGVSHLWAKIKATFALISHTHGIGDVTNLQTSLDGKQATLVSGTNIKTVGSQSLLGSGNLTPANIGAAASSHAHGNITSGGDITATAPAVASGDKLVINDESASKITNGPSFGTNTAQYLRNDGAWGIPAGTTYGDYDGTDHGLVPWWEPASGTEDDFAFIALDAEGNWRPVAEMIQANVDDAEGATGSGGYLYIDGNNGLDADDSGSLMTSAEKTKLEGIAAGAQVNSITGVKGNSESSYRTGNVNLTAANIGAAASSHAHGNITSAGDITAAAPTVASGDKLVINDESASKITNGPSFGTSTTTYLRNDGTWATPTDTDTKNTAGSTDSSAKLFLIGAISQAANPQTYSHDTAYVGTDGHLYSNSKQVVNLSDEQALTNKTLNGLLVAYYAENGIWIWNQESGSTSTRLVVPPNKIYTLGPACEKSIGSVADGNAGLVTGDAVYDAIQSAMSDVAGALVYKGTVGTGGTVTDLPASHTKGWYYVVSTAGTYAGKTCEVGDMLICNTTGTTANNAHWDAVQSNITALTTTEIDAIVAAA